MELRAYLDALRVRWWLVAGLALLGAVAGLTAFLLTPAVYASTVTFYVSVPPEAGGSTATATQYAQAKVSSYVTLVESEEAARRVVADQGLTASPSAVASSVSASAQLNTTLLTAIVRSGSADYSERVAQGLADTFGPLVDQLDNGGRPEQVIGVAVVSGPTAAQAVSPDLERYVGLGLVAGLVLGALLAVLRDLLDTTVRTSTATAEVVGAPTLAVVDEDPDPAGRAESVRQLRTGLTYLQTPGEPGSRVEVLVVASALDGEGKTTTVLDLARSLAEAGERVLLVEADLRRPRLAAALGVGGGPGLSEVLSGQADLASPVRASGVDGLDVLPAGSVPPNPAELLGSRRMGDLVANLRRGHDRVLIDAPAVLPVTDAVVTAAHADGVLLLVRWGRTRRAEVAEAVGMLQRGRATVLGGVLTRRHATRAQRRRYAPEAPRGSRRTGPAERAPRPLRTARAPRS